MEKITTKCCLLDVTWPLLLPAQICTRLGYQHEWQRGLCCPSLPEELLADGDCWRKGVTVFSGVASGKLAML